MAFDYKEKFSVAGKKCIVTGAAQGLSRGMAEGLLENGAEVVLMDLQAEKLQAVADEYCKMGYKAHAVAGDLSYPRSQRSTVCSQKLWRSWEISWML